MQSVVILAIALCCLQPKSSVQQLEAVEPEVEDRIAGGTPVDIETVPYQVFLSVEGKPFCGGTIISPTFVLTAAQCTFKYIKNVKEIDVTAGTSFTNSGGIQRKLKRIIQHERFINTTRDYDYSLIELNSALPLSKSVKPVNLPEGSLIVRHGSSCLVSGWGLIGDSPQKPTDLQAANVTAIKTQLCAMFYKNQITDRMLCTVSTHIDKAACRYDNGGPLVWRGKLVGIVSWGLKKCGDSKIPNVYSKVTAVREWIKQSSGA